MTSQTTAAGARKRLDVGSDNPRLQCSACGRWMRLHGKDKDGNQFYRFYGGCGFTGGDHLAGTDGGCVCDECCQTKCAAIAKTGGA